MKPFTRDNVPLDLVIIAKSDDNYRMLYRPIRIDLDGVYLATDNLDGHGPMRFFTWEELFDDFWWVYDDANGYRHEALCGTP